MIEEICKNCFYREGDHCGFNPSKSTIIPACNYSFPALRNQDVPTWFVEDLIECKNCGRKYKIKMKVYLEEIQEDEYTPYKEAEKKIVGQKDD